MEIECIGKCNRMNQEALQLFNLNPNSWICADCLHTYTSIHEFLRQSSAIPNQVPGKTYTQLGPNQ